MSSPPYAEPSAMASGPTAQPPFPDEGVPGGFEKLVDLLLDQRRRMEGVFRAALPPFAFAHSENDIKSLISLVYETTFKKEEGRYPRFTLLLPWRYNGTLPTPILSFCSTQLTPQVLRRLSAAIPTKPYALRIRVTDGEVWADGTLRVAAPGWMPRSQDMNCLSNGLATMGGMMIEVRGPGELSVRDFGVDLDLREGRLFSRRDEEARYSVPAHFLWCFSEAEAEVTRALNELRSPRVEGGATYHWATFVQETWAHVLRCTVDLGHGGAYVVLPKGHDRAGLLHLDFELTGFGFLGLICRYAASHMVPDGAGRQMALDALLDGVKTLVQLSATDGCVVLDGGLDLFGFGAKILVPKSAEACPVFDHILTPTDRSLNMNTVGTRHGSAFALAQKVPGATVFVVSQDGHLRIFHHRLQGGSIGVIQHAAVGETHYAGR
jgi:hypothetical protein